MAQRASVTRCLATLGGAVVVAGVLVVGLVLAVTLFSSKADTSNQFPSSGDVPLRIAAVGDGFMSGEGATAFFPGTDRPGSNQCRRAGSSYPFVLAATFQPPAPFDGVELVSAACSGALTTNVIAFADLDCREEWFPDGCPRPQYDRAADGNFDPRFQIERVPDETDIVLAAVGAGDAHLLDITAMCAETAESCVSAVDPWIESMDAILDWRLRRVYRALRERSPGAEIVVLTYPSILFGDACPASKLEQDETEAVARLLDALNASITRAARAESVHIIDLTEVFTGHRVCQPDRPDGQRPQRAANAFQLRPVRGISWKLSSWFHGSFHPNAYGHDLIAEHIATDLTALLTGREEPGSRSRLQLPAPAFEVGSPLPASLSTESACGSPIAATRVVPRPIRSSLVLDDADPDTTTCYRSVSGPWRSRSTGDAIGFRVPLESHDANGFAGWHEILYRSQGSWARVVVVAPADGNAYTLSLAKAWLWPWLVVLAEIVSHPVIYATLIALAIGGSLMWCTRRRREEAS